MNDLDTRLIKAVEFFRKFNELSDKTLYKKYVLRFCDLVEQKVKNNSEPEKGVYENAKEIFTK